MRTIYSEYITNGRGDKMGVRCKKDNSRKIVYEGLAQDCRGEVRIIVYEEKQKIQNNG